MWLVVIILILATVAVSLAVSSLLLGCAAPPIAENLNLGEHELVARPSLTTSIIRTIDAEAGVVCWVYIGIEQGGICCLPLSETKLDGGR
uniref:Uncharacterized protein n=1 Tax=viral metagenome TaxID=1070528 RepID=A0A6M3XTR6_9ZZZZ